MSRNNRSVFFMSLFPLVLGAGALTAAQAQNAGVAAKPTNWSDPATWPNRKVPVAGDKVTIGKDKEVVLDVSPPALGGLSIDGKLSFSDNADLELTTEWIMVHGELAIGTEAKPYTRKATITLTDNVKGEDVMAGMGDRGIMLSGGTLNLHGSTTNTWTKLSSTANAGATSIQVLDAKGWKVGDEIVLASTDFNPRQAERRTIAAISGNTITLDKGLEYMHFGKITFDVDERGEVGLLTRNVKIQASADAEQTLLRWPHHGDAVEHHACLRRRAEPHGPEPDAGALPDPLAPGGRGQGPVHQERGHPRHLQPLRDRARHEQPAGREQRHLQHRGSLLLPGRRHRARQPVRARTSPSRPSATPASPASPTNLAGGGRGHAASAGPQRASASKDVLLPSDNTVASYWITNPNNTYRDNVAAGSDSNGFWMSLPEHPNGQFEGTEISKATWPRRTQFREFKGNVAHSNYDGFMFDRNINANNTFGVTGSSHTGLENPADPNSKARGIGVREPHRLQEPQWRPSGAAARCTCSGT